MAFDYQPGHLCLARKRLTRPKLVNNCGLAGVEMGYSCLLRKEHMHVLCACSQGGSGKFLLVVIERWESSSLLSSIDCSHLSNAVYP